MMALQLSFDPRVPTRWLPSPEHRLVIRAHLLASARSPLLSDTARFIARMAVDDLSRHGHLVLDSDGPHTETGLRALLAALAIDNRLPLAPTRAALLAAAIDEAVTAIRIELERRGA